MNETSNNRPGDSATNDSHSSPRILICRLSHIGDCILTLPTLHALREAFPNAYIAWAVEKPTNQLLERHPQLDQVITVPKGWMKRLSTIRQVRKELRSHRFDISVDPQSIAKSAMLGWLSGAKTRIGFSGKYGRELSTRFNNRLHEPTSTHLVDRSLELLSLLNFKTESVRFNLPIDDSAFEYVDRFLYMPKDEEVEEKDDAASSTSDESGLIGNRPFAVINPGASWPSKRWNPSRFAELASQLKQRTDLQSVVTWAGPEELQMAEQIVSESNGAALLAPKTSLQQLAALLKHASIFVGCDTGPLHLASAVGTACVGLYGPTRPEDSGAYGDQHQAIQNKYHAGTSRERRSANNDAMLTIHVDQVLEACCRTIATQRLRDVEQIRRRVA